MGNRWRLGAEYIKNPFDTPERVAFRKTLRDFVAKEIKPNADTWDEAGEIPWDLHQRVGALGVWGFGIEEQYGGLGMDDCFMRAAYNEEFAMCGANGVPAALNSRMISIEPIQHLANAVMGLLASHFFCGCGHTRILAHTPRPKNGLVVRRSGNALF